MSSVNLYDVLNLSNDCSIKEIKDAYRVLVKEFHPDRPGGDAEMFELVTHAYNILSNPNFRKEYDELFSLSKQVETSHFDLKQRAKKYYEALDNDSTQKKKSKDDYKKDFKKNFDDMDRKHGLSRDGDLFDKLDQKDTMKRLRDLEYARKTDEIESTPEMIFDRFNVNTFNAAFDAMHKGHDELIPHSGNPSAFNAVGGFSNFSSINQYENLYAEDEDIGTSAYGSLKLDQSRNKKLSKDDVRKLKPVDYTTRHNYKDKEYSKSLEEKIRERELETKKLDDRDMKDFTDDPTCGGYGIFHQLGVNNLNTINWDDEEDIKTRYKRLLELRKQDYN